MCLYIYIFVVETRQVLLMLLTISFAYLILTSPFYMKIAISHFSDFAEETNPETLEDIITFNTVTFSLYILNFAINFYLYVISGSKFRKDLVTIFHCMTNRKVPRKARTETGTFTSGGAVTRQQRISTTMTSTSWM